MDIIKNKIAIDIIKNHLKEHLKEYGPKDKYRISRPQIADSNRLSNDFIEAVMNNFESDNNTALILKGIFPSLNIQYSLKDSSQEKSATCKSEETESEYKIIIDCCVENKDTPKKIGETGRQILSINKEDLSFTMTASINIDETNALVLNQQKKYQFKNLEREIVENTSVWKRETQPRLTTNDIAFADQFLETTPALVEAVMNNCNYRYQKSPTKECSLIQEFSGDIPGIRFNYAEDDNGFIYYSIIADITRDEVEILMNYKTYYQSYAEFFEDTDWGKENPLLNELREAIQKAEELGIPLKTDKEKTTKTREKTS